MDDIGRGVLRDDPLTTTTRDGTAELRGVSAGVVTGEKTRVLSAAADNLH